jgi:hypothetical protein
VPLRCQQELHTHGVLEFPQIKIQKIQVRWACRPCSGSCSTSPKGFKSGEPEGHVVGPPLPLPKDSSQVSMEAMQWVLLYLSQRIQVRWACRPCSGSSSTSPKGFKSGEPEGHAVGPPLPIHMTRQHLAQHGWNVPERHHAFFQL